MYRRKNAQFPRLPRTIRDVVIPESCSRTIDGRNFLLHIDNRTGILILGTRRNLRKLQRCRMLYQDGTFKCTPRPYTQFFTIHGRYKGKVLPLVFSLLPNKEGATYTRFYQVLKRKCLRENGRELAPNIIISDNESGLLAVVPNMFPNSRLDICFFSLLSSRVETHPKSRFSTHLHGQRKIPAVR